ncbi:MAG TPA: tagaturonate epimerase family protein, partial [Spirochaetia bacterium]|nr:tagaturonate epimerase family protein [Spirochaetia bacterium]
PISLRDKKTTIGCGDRLGLATPGHLRAANKFDCYPVLAQQSVRELTLTKRDFQSVARDVSFLVFQEGYERGYGSDGDHLKKMADIDLALEAGMPMITLDLTEVMHPDPASWSTAKIDSEFEKLDDSIAQPVLRMYAGKTFKLSSSTIVFGAEEVKRCTLMYWDMLEFTKQVDSHLKDKRGDQYDLEISIDETTTPTVPSHHLFIASELQNRGVVVNSLAPRFIGEFQKGIDYIGKVEEFDKQFMVHCDIARAYGNYKVSIHSGSDKFSVYPSIGKYTRERLHLKTAGTSWLEAMRVVARTNPALFRRMLAKAFDYFPEATKLYHITADIHQIRDAREVDDAHLDEYLNDSNSRQLIHITYGGLLNDPDLRSEFFRTLDEHEEEHYATIERHLTKHIELLGVERRQ